MIEPGAQPDELEHRAVDVVEHHHVYVGVLRHLRQAYGCPHGCLELVIVHVVHHPVAGGEAVAVFLKLRLWRAVYDLAVDRVREETDLRTELGEHVVGVDVGAPHRLVVVGEQSHGRLAHDGACARSLGEDPDLRVHLLA